MAIFNYEKVLERRNHYPVLGGTKYVSNGEVLFGDMWINRILAEKPDTVVVVVTKSFLMLQQFKKTRDQLFDIYNVNALIEIDNRFLGNGFMPGVFVRLSKTQTNKIKIARFTREVILQKAKVPEDVTKIFVMKKNLLDESDIEAFRKMPAPIYTDEFLSFMENVKRWIEKNIDDIGHQYFHVEIKREIFSYDRLSAVFYTEESLNYFKYIRNENFVELHEVADIISGIDYSQPMPESYTIKKLGLPDFSYPINYSSLKTRQPKSRARLLMKGDIIASTISGDGTLRVYLINEDPKEDLMAGIGCYIIRARNVSAEYLYLYLQSDTVKKYVFYNTPFLQISVQVLRTIPISLPTERMQAVAKFAFAAAHPSEEVVSIEEINELLREDVHIPVNEKPLQSILLEELLNTIKLEKRCLIEDLITADSREIQECFDAGAYKACLIICGSILETVLLDWLSEIENTNYFVDDENMQINLYGVISRLKDIYRPNWNREAAKAHDVRLKRNLVHPVKYIVERPEISREVCLQVFEELKDILLSRGIETEISVN